MVEGARLERVYTGNRIEGSNPSLTARKALILLAFFFSLIFSNDFRGLADAVLDVVRQTR